MTHKVVYRASAALLLLFAIGHTIGFLNVPPEWHADGVVKAMQTTQFVVMGSTRNYWSFFAGFGFFVTTFLLLSAVVSWEFGGLQPAALRSLSRVLVLFALAYIVIAVLTWMYFFLVPGILATLAALGLTIGAMQVRRSEA